MIRLGFEPKTHSLEGCCSIQLSYQTCLERVVRSGCKVNHFFSSAIYLLHFFNSFSTSFCDISSVNAEALKSHSIIDSIIDFRRRRILFSSVRCNLFCRRSFFCRRRLSVGFCSLLFIGKGIYMKDVMAIDGKTPIAITCFWNPVSLLKQS